MGRIIVSPSWGRVTAAFCWIRLGVRDSSWDSCWDTGILRWLVAAVVAGVLGWLVTGVVAGMLGWLVAGLGWLVFRVKEE
ncbi:hypothetical protein Hamer_G013174 [Homarus americanus]|uniref:Uncharacterized protein n=1 Tax=Homarus americanus TaxID=6706 RepID=A0A8J5MWI8_HOMAM|nr:hypothetical protein Hamer_G013174 [Homarus americanus]